MKPAGAAWAALAAGVAAASAAVAAGRGLASPTLIDWRPDLAATQPWRAWSAALVHLGPAHLWANLAGAAVVGWFGWRADVQRWAVMAWFVAWPLTQVGLLLRPDLSVYAGLSGVLHAGVAVLVVHLVWQGRRRERLLGLAVAGGLVVKLVLEQPFGPALRAVPAAGIQVAPFAHLSGALAGLLCAVLARLAARRGVNKP